MDLQLLILRARQRTRAQTAACCLDKLKIEYKLNKEDHAGSKEDDSKRIKFLKEDYMNVDIV